MIGVFVSASFFIISALLTSRMRSSCYDFMVNLSRIEKTVASISNALSLRTGKRFFT